MRKVLNLYATPSLSVDDVSLKVNLNVLLGFFRTAAQNFLTLAVLIKNAFSRFSKLKSFESP
jgi:hypothetical protein